VKLILVCALSDVLAFAFSFVTPPPEVGGWGGGKGWGSDSFEIKNVSLPSWSLFSLLF